MKIDVLELERKNKKEEDAKPNLTENIYEKNSI